MLRNVLNLVISGIPSIQNKKRLLVVFQKVLNLVISGIPSIPTSNFSAISSIFIVLNLVISGIPSIL